MTYSFLLKTKEDLLPHIEKIIGTLSEHKSTASREFLYFFQTSVVFLGFVISTKGVMMDPHKLKPISDCLLAFTLKNLQCFFVFFRIL